eukprot:CAMPEP_0203782872 /NCGR_PEP_ID=MMETSP0099_2-20121227/11342_1 /ASSEMBLY_ACC=CAM_ASM_000209 /TAXON_ID=96639 /ORGANISM=" , Strain NY0313808BC1" /LENGTH=670 /DNA_ID=CAMNT_0050684637 /DNA_START=273 /DNA_END=2282 /DNA_ORIENTATION=-
MDQVNKRPSSRWKNQRFSKLGLSVKNGLYKNTNNSASSPTLSQGRREEINKTVTSPRSSSTIPDAFSNRYEEEEEAKHVETIGNFLAPPHNARSDLVKQKSNGMYLELVAEKGLDLFQKYMIGDDDDDDKFDESSKAPPPHLRKLPETPSMVMLSEAAELLSESPSALMPMDVTSTGGVYQLRRQKSVYYVPENNVLPTPPPYNTLTKQPASSRLQNSFTPSTFSFNSVEDAGPKATITRSSSLASAEASSRFKPGSGLCMPKRSRSVVRFCVKEEEQAPRPSHSLADSKLRRASTGNLPTSHSPVDASALSRLLGGETLAAETLGTPTTTGATTLKRRGASRVAVFKPEDEETGANVSQGVGKPNPERAGMVVGGGAKRERAAYLLDKHSGRFSGVPETALVFSKMPVDKKTTGPESTSPPASPNRPKAFRMKRGSLQRFCESDGSAEDRPDLVRLAPPRQVHKIGVLDLRLFNTDRHGGNILCKKEVNGETTLIPIDHALSLPDWHFLAEAYFDWQYWAQSDAKFDQDTLQVIENLDVEKDAHSLRELGIPESCVATNMICTLALKIGARYGLHLKELGLMFQRPFCAGHNLHNKYFSPLEHVVMEACERSGGVYHPAGSIERVNVSAGECENVEEGEGKVFGNCPPPSGFFLHFEKALVENCETGKW